MARFAQYAMASAEEALNDAGWSPKTQEDLEATVCLLNTFPLQRAHSHRAYILDLALVPSTMLTIQLLPTMKEYDMSKIPTGMC